MAEHTKFMGEVALDALWDLMVAYLEKNTSKIWIGTQADYAAAASSMAEGTLVYITDDADSEIDTTSAILGTAILGKMILG